ncbi:MAG: PP2C family protein-serine/threonine phosphatase [Ignavibacteriae bacterium]|nr:PP2C family protein-serine/threonine phosphatase [Ignavibacteriota bacterium]
MYTVQWIEKLPKYILFIVSILFVTILGFLDYLSGTDLSFYIFYVIPVLFIVWFAGKRWGVFICFFCFASWYIDTFYKRGIELNSMVLYWNMLVELSFFTLIIFSVSALKKAIEKQEETERQKISRELSIAKEVQQKLFPQSSPEIKQLEYYGLCLPAEAVGGDYYDYFKINQNETAFAIGDISGHGLSSALLMAGLVGFVRSNAIMYNDDLKIFMEKVNRLMCDSTDGSKFATFFYSVYNSKTNTLRFVNAGHNPPLLYKSKTKSFDELKTDGFIIGGICDFKYKDAAVKFDCEDLLLYYTDGITEYFNQKNEQFGEDRLKNVIEENYNLSAKEICNKIIEEVKSYSNGIQQADDMTLLAIKIN